VHSRWGTGRIEAFSDGVFAIAITLLVLELRIPASAYDDLWAAILDEWPAYLGYATSFITIGGIWLVHHSVFHRLAYADSTVMRLNLLLLLAVAFLPFPTQLVAEAIGNADAERTAVVFYGVALLACWGLLGTIWTSITLRREDLAPEVSDQEAAALLGHTAPSISFFVLLTLLAVRAPRAAAFGYLISAIVVVLRARGD
jgi:uncharacterized membrane protein